MIEVMLLLILLALCAILIAMPRQQVPDPGPLLRLQYENAEAERKYRESPEYQRECDRTRAQLARWKRGEFTSAELQQLNEGVE